MFNETKGGPLRGWQHPGAKIRFAHFKKRRLHHESWPSFTKNTMLAYRWLNQGGCSSKWCALAVRMALSSDSSLRLAWALVDCPPSTDWPELIWCDWLLSLFSWLLERLAGSGRDVCDDSPWLFFRRRDLPSSGGGSWWLTAGLMLAISIASDERLRSMPEPHSRDNLRPIANVSSLFGDSKGLLFTYK